MLDKLKWRLILNIPLLKRSTVMLFHKKHEKKVPWNKGKLIGQKLPLKPEQIWSIRIHLQMDGKVRDLALFNLALDSKLRGCDLVKLTVKDISVGNEIKSRSSVLQQKTKHPVKFEITLNTQQALSAWIDYAKLRSVSYLFPNCIHPEAHLSTQQYARIVNQWVESIGLDFRLEGAKVHK